MSLHGFLKNVGRLFARDFVNKEEGEYVSFISGLSPDETYGQAQERTATQANFARQVLAFCILITSSIFIITIQISHDKQTNQLTTVLAVIFITTLIFIYIAGIKIIELEKRKILSCAHMLLLDVKNKEEELREVEKEVEKENTRDEK